MKRLGVLPDYLLLLYKYAISPTSITALKIQNKKRPPDTTGGLLKKYLLWITLFQVAPTRMLDLVLLEDDWHLR